MGHSFKPSATYHYHHTAPSQYAALQHVALCKASPKLLFVTSNPDVVTCRACLTRLNPVTLNEPSPPKSYKRILPA